MRHTILFVTMTLVLAGATVADGQQRPAPKPSIGPPARQPARTVRSRMGDTALNVSLRNTTARSALDWFSQNIQIPMVVNWRALEFAGIDPQTPVNITLRRVRVRDLLNIILRQISVDVRLMYQINPQYVEVLTREQANRMTDVRVYDVSDLLMEVRRYRNSPSFDLNEALSNTDSGGSGNSGGRGGRSGGGGGRGGGGSGSLFTDDEDEDQEEFKSRSERAEDLAQLIRNTIEPDIWLANGGEYASITYFQSRLIINAPRYVHDQIGGTGVRAVGSSARSTARTSTSPTRRRSSATRPRSYRYRRSGVSGVSGVSQSRARPVSGVR